MQRHRGVGAVERLAALVRRHVDGVARLDEGRDVGDRVVHDVAAAVALEVERLVEVHRARRVDGDERQVGPVEVGQSRGRRRAPRGLLDLGRERGRHLEVALDLRDPVTQGLRAHLVTGVDPNHSTRGHGPHPSVWRVLILLPPSEGKSAPRRGAPLRPDVWPAGLAEPREHVLSALLRLCQGDLDTAVATLGLGPTQADDVRRNARLRELPTAAAERVYTGVLYDALGLTGLSASAHRRALSPGGDHLLALRTRPPR